MNLRVQTIPPVPPTKFSHWLKTPQRCIKAHGFYRWLWSEETKEKTFSHADLIRIIRTYVMHEKRYDKQFQLLYQDYLAGLTEPELCAKYLVNPKKLQWVLKTKGRNLPQETVEITDQFIKARLTQLMLDVDDAVKDLKGQLKDAELKDWLEEEQTISEGGGRATEIKTRKSAASKARRELWSSILKTHMALFEGVGQLIPKASINLQVGKDLASLPQETLEQLIEQEKKRLKPNATVRTEPAIS